MITELPALTCPRCGRPGSGFTGCGHCATHGVAVNLVPEAADLRGRELRAFRGGPWAWPDTLAIRGSERVTLGEGGTPLIPDALDAAVLLKLESHNPTGSHKDRAMSVGVTVARSAGYRTVVAASSGNAGASAAAYAARAGLSAIVTTTEGVPSAIRAQIVATGATLAIYGTSAERNAATRRLVDDFGCFPLTNFVDPGPGSNTLAIDGYKSIAYELASEAPDARCVCVPTSRADLVAGIARGYAELAAAGLISALPQLVIAEPASGSAFTSANALPRSEQEITTAVRRGSAAFSIGSDLANYQGLHAMWTSRGHAVAVAEEGLLDEYDNLRRTGLWVEASAATAVRAARLELGQGGTVVAIVSAGGTKDPKLLEHRPAEHAVMFDPDPGALMDAVGGHSSTRPVPAAQSQLPSVTREPSP